MYKQDLALNNLERMICHKIQLTRSEHKCVVVIVARNELCEQSSNHGLDCFNFNSRWKGISQSLLSQAVNSNAQCALAREGKNFLFFFSAVNCSTRWRVSYAYIYIYIYI